MGTTYMDFSTGVFHVDGDAPLTQKQVDSVWHHLPTTGASWIEHGNLLVQQFEGAPTFNLGSVEHGVKGASAGVRFGGPSKQGHATKRKSPAQLQREIDKALAKPSSKAKSAAVIVYSRPSGYWYAQAHDATTGARISDASGYSRENVLRELRGKFSMIGVTITTITDEDPYDTTKR